VWDTSLESIERKYPELKAGVLFTFLTRFDRGSIQNEVFRLSSLDFSAISQEFSRGYQDLPAWLKEFIRFDGQNLDSFRYRQAFKPLVRYNLLQRVDKAWPGVTMHNLIQWRAMKYEKDQARLLYLRHQYRIDIVLY
jgi:hypothetical protein